jgi:hypothetical protein
MAQAEKVAKGPRERWHMRPTFRECQTPAQGSNVSEQLRSQAWSYALQEKEWSSGSRHAVLGTGLQLDVKNTFGHCSDAGRLVGPLRPYCPAGRTETRVPTPLKEQLQPLGGEGEARRGGGGRQGICPRRTRCGTPLVPLEKGCNLSGGGDCRPRSPDSAGVAGALWKGLTFLLEAFHFRSRYFARLLYLVPCLVLLDLSIPSWTAAITASRRTWAQPCLMYTFLLSRCPFVVLSFPVFCSANLEIDAGLVLSGGVSMVANVSENFAPSAGLVRRLAQVWADAHYEQ